LVILELPVPLGKEILVSLGLKAEKEILVLLVLKALAIPERRVQKARQDLRAMATREQLAPLAMEILGRLVPKGSLVLLELGTQELLARKVEMVTPEQPDLLVMEIQA